MESCNDAQTNPRLLHCSIRCRRGIWLRHNRQRCHGLYAIFHALLWSHDTRTRASRSLLMGVSMDCNVISSASNGRLHDRIRERSTWEKVAVRWGLSAFCCRSWSSIWSNITSYASRWQDDQWLCHRMSICNSHSLGI
jgi:hypothetical protein